jgi:hypothetical protein
MEGESRGVSQEKRRRTEEEEKEDEDEDEMVDSRLAAG